MTNLIKIVKKDIDRKYQPDYLNQTQAERVLAFHQGLPTYEPTPLVSLDGLAQELGLGSLHVKDESSRLGLDAFKVLGGSYAASLYIADLMGWTLNEITFDDLASKEVKDRLGTLTFITATDGNHGKSLAWAAKELGHEAIVLMPQGSSPQRVQAIKDQGADVRVMPFNYDACVEEASRLAESEGYVLVQDTAWPGYEDMPKKIMEGYLTIGEEIKNQIDEPPTHVLLQAGVGSFAAALIGYLQAVYDNLTFCLVEPRAADPFFRTAQADDGLIHPVDGDLATIMAGLACGQPSSLAWPIISSNVAYYASIEDPVAARGMKVLAQPLGDDKKIIAGESGAAPLGLVYQLCTDPDLESYKKALGLGPASRVLVINTEGATDRENYERIVDGE